MVVWIFWSPKRTKCGCKCLIAVLNEETTTAVGPDDKGDTKREAQSGRCDELRISF
jgi:hypothetical protein